MKRIQQHRLLMSVIMLALVLTIIVAGYGVFLAGEAGKLPWQVDPTRIPVTPFSDFPGFGSPSTPISTPGSS
jgi:hypothetical protein